MFHSTFNLDADDAQLSHYYNVSSAEPVPIHIFFSIQSRPGKVGDLRECNGGRVHEHAGIVYNILKGSHTIKDETCTFFWHEPKELAVVCLPSVLAPKQTLAREDSFANDPVWKNDHGQAGKFDPRIKHPCINYRIKQHEE